MYRGHILTESRPYSSWELRPGTTLSDSLNLTASYTTSKYLSRTETKEFPDLLCQLLRTRPFYLGERKTPDRPWTSLPVFGEFSSAAFFVSINPYGV